MTHLLDSNACIVHLRSGGGSRVSAKLRAAAPGAVGVSSVVREELLFGALHSANVQANLRQVEALLSALASIPFDDAAAEASAQIRAALERAGSRIGFNDALIAGTAVSLNLILVTHNVGEFSRVPGLRIEDWEARRPRPVHC